MKTISITHGPSGRALKNPLILEINRRQTLGDGKTLQFILDTFVPKSPQLAAFAYRNSSALAIARYYLFYRTGSKGTLLKVMYNLAKFCKWAGMEPDQLIKQCLRANGGSDFEGQAKIRLKIDDFLYYLKLIKKYENVTIGHYVAVLKTFFALNGVNLLLPYNLKSGYEHQCYAVTREQIQEILNVSTLRERVIITVLATSGLRIGTLSKLKYKNIKQDFERNVVPLCIPVNASIAKGNYQSFCTFINQEAVDQIKAYLGLRRIGTAKIPPEEVNDESPLIRSAWGSHGYKTVRPVKESGLQSLVHELFFKAGLITRGVKNKRYDFRGYSLRKFFKTELATRGVNGDCIEFMLGHKVSRYSDPMFKGIEYLRGVYLSAGLRIKPKETLTKIEALKEIIASWGLDPNKILSQQILSCGSEKWSHSKEGDFTI